MEPENLKNNNRMYTGILLIAVGILLFASKMGAPIPDWIISWQTAMIAFGALLCIRQNFRNPGGFILIAIGALNLADMLNPALNFHDYIFPVIILVLGLVFVLRPSGGSFRGGGRWRRRYDDKLDSPLHFSEDEKKNNSSDFIDSTSVFGGVKKVILSKDFRGGDVTCFMGGAEFNLTQADIQTTAVLDVTQVFGGTKIIVPASWNIKTEVITIFGGVEDKRPVSGNNINPEKVLIIKGTSIFGGIDIRSY